MRRQPTRRELVRSGIAATVALSGLGSAQQAFAAAAAGPSDSHLISETLRTEQLVVFAYRRALSTGALAGSAQKQVRSLLAHELEHVAALARELRRLGVAVPTPPATVASAQAALDRQHLAASLVRLPTRHACLRLLIDIETMAEAAYFTAISQLRDPALIRTFTEAMGCEAQHWTLLSSLQHPGEVNQAVPYPFVRGSAGY